MIGYVPELGWIWEELHGSRTMSFYRWRDGQFERVTMIAPMLDSGGWEYPDGRVNLRGRLLVQIPNEGMFVFDVTTNQWKDLEVPLCIQPQ